MSEDKEIIDSNAKLEKLLNKITRTLDAHATILENHGAALMSISDGVAMVAEKVGLKVMKAKDRLDS